MCCRRWRGSGAWKTSIVPSFTLSPATLPADTINVAYAHQTITASGGTGNVTLAVNVTNAIPGLSITGNGTSSIGISGTPTAVGTETFTVTGTDSASDTTGPVSYSITVNPAITLSSTTPALIVTSYVTNAVYEFDADTGALLKTLVAPNSQSILVGPAGVTVGPDGNLYITGEGFGGNGTYNIVEYNVGTGTLSTFISGAQMEAANGGVPFAPGGIAFGPDGNLYTDNTLPGTGADQVIRFDIANTDGDLSYTGTSTTIATGLSVACDITFGANPGDQGNLYVSDDNSVLKITGATTVSPTSAPFVPAGSGGLGYSCGLTWQDGDLYVTDPGGGQVLKYSDTGAFLGVFTSSALQGQSPINSLFLPDGDVVTSNYGSSGTQGSETGSLVEFNSSGALLQNLGSGAFPANAAGVTGVALAFMTFDTTAPAAESTVVLAQDTIDAPYNQVITPNGGTGAVALTVSNVQNAIPGLNITGNGTGSLSIMGMPTATGTETFTVTATDSVGGTTITNYTLTVNPAPTLTPGSLPADTIDVAYNQSITASGGTGNVRLAVNVSNAIPGLSIVGNGTGRISISGTPTAAGTETFTVTGTDGAGGTTGPVSYSITVNPAITLNPSLPADTINTAYSQTITAGGGTGTVTLTVSNVQNAIAGLNVPTGGTGNLAITGTPTATGTETFTVTATDALGASTSATYSITVNPAVAVNPTLSLPPQVSGFQGTPTALDISTGAPGSVVSVTISGVPTGVTFSAGTNNGNGSWTFTQAQLAGLTITAPTPESFALTVAVTASSAAGTTTASGALPVVIRSAVPTIAVSAPPSFNPQNALTISVSSAAPGDEVVQSVTVNWGDGTVQTFTGPPGSYTHQYAVSSSTYTVQVSVTDQNGTFAAPSTAVVAALPTTQQGEVAMLYLDILGRSADPAGLSYWSGLLASGAPTSRVVAGLMTSPEYQTKVLNGLYVQYLGRPVDPSGAATFLALLQTSGPEAVAAALISSPEFFTKAGGTNTGFLQVLYLDVLGRPIESGALTNELNVLGLGTSTEQVAAGVLAGTEAAQDAVEQAYETYLGRPADPAGLPGWEQNFLNDPATFLALFLSSPEFAQRAAADTTVTPTNMGTPSV